MSAQSDLASRPLRRVLASGMVFAAALIPLLLTSCTREELASAMATVVVDLQATLEPLSATVEAGGLLSEGPTSAAPAATIPPIPGQTPALAQSTVTGPPLTPPPTSTPQPSPTAQPSPTPEPSPTPLPGEINQGGSVMVLVPGGFFKMGAGAAEILAECALFRPGCDASWFAASEPAHTVLVAPFYIDQFEVTNLDYLGFLSSQTADAALCGEAGCINPEQSQLQPADSGAYQISPELATHPVAGVSWFGATAYCGWRNARLPTEAEWEKAASWNATTETKAIYPWGDEFEGTRVNFCDVNCDAPQANADWDDGFAESAPVGSLPKNRSVSGAYDMAGNLWEWVADWYGEAYYGESATANPTGPVEGTEKVVRGGSWFDTGNFTSGLIRFPSAPENSDKTIGFRCASGVH